MKNDISYTHCLNCQTELQGRYCHVCGQQATDAKPTIKEFILEYLNIAFIWDTHFLKTIWNVLRRPGHTTNEYVSGKFVSYTHPLKLNMFLLFVFITLFLIFHKDFGNSIQNVTRDEVTYPLIQIEILNNNAQYAEMMKASTSDTVQIYAPLILADTYPDIIKAIDASDSSPRDTMMVWTAVLPHKLIEDEVILVNEKGYYSFSDEDKTGVLGTQVVENIWGQMVKLTTTYFPVIILLTVPFLAFSLRLTHRKGNHSRFKHFIFSLHYTAFLEMFIIILYLTKLIADPPAWVMGWAMILVSCTYLTLSIKKVYESRSWYGAASQAIFTNIVYAVTLMLLFIAIFLVSLAIVAIQMN